MKKINNKTYTTIADLLNSKISPRETRRNIDNEEIIEMDPLHEKYFVEKVRAFINKQKINDENKIIKDAVSTFDELKESIKNIPSVKFANKENYLNDDSVNIIILPELTGKTSIAYPDLILKSDNEISLISIKRSHIPKAEYAIELVHQSRVLKENGIEVKSGFILLNNGTKEEIFLNEYQSYYDLLVGKLNKLKENNSDVTMKDLSRMNLKEAVEIADTNIAKYYPALSKGERSFLIHNDVNTLADLDKVEEFDKSVVDKIKNQDELFHSDDKFLIKNTIGESLEIDDQDIYVEIRESDSYGTDVVTYFYSIRKSKTIKKTFVYHAIKAKEEKKALVNFTDKLFEILEESKRIVLYSKREIDSLMRASSRHNVKFKEIEELIHSGRLVTLETRLKTILFLNSFEYSLKKIAEVVSPKSGNIYDFYDEKLQIIDTYSKEDFKIAYEKIVESSERKLLLLKELHKLISKNIKSFDPNGVLRKECIIFTTKSGAKYTKPEKINLNTDSPEKEFISSHLMSDLVNFYQREKLYSHMERRVISENPLSDLFLNRNAISCLIKESIEVAKKDDSKVYRITYRMNDNEVTSIGFKTKVIILPPFTDFSFFKNVPSKFAKGEVVAFEDGKVVVEYLEEYKDHPLVSRDKISIMTVDNYSTDNLEKSLHSFAEKMNNDGILDFIKKDSNNSEKNGDLVTDISNSIKSDNSNIVSIQGPPGSGKTEIVSNVIGQLKGKRILIVSNSHSAITNLLERIISVVGEDDVYYNSYQPAGCEKFNYFKLQRKKFSNIYELEARGNPSAIIGTTAFKAHTIKDIDYIFIEEAGQMSLAGLIAASVNSRKIILVGDVNQLGQPSSTPHPGRSGLSCLDYLDVEGDAKKAESFNLLSYNVKRPADFFLPVSYRMQKELCKFISDSFYDGKLVSFENDESVTVKIDKLDKGLTFRAIDHKNSSQSSEMEASVVVSTILELLDRNVVSSDGTSRKMNPSDIIVISPFNLQVKQIQDLMISNDRNAELMKIQIGTVDKFQGKEALVSIYSLGASIVPPRGVSFLFNKNRTNVALSRGRVSSIVIGSRELLNVPVSTLEELDLVALFTEIMK
jgi:Ni2+-binding GTPase involved in maturation of urease and hydrogenase